MKKSIFAIFAAAVAYGTFAASDTFPRKAFVRPQGVPPTALDLAKGHSYYAGYKLEANGTEIACTVGKAQGAGACWTLPLRQSAAAPVELAVECKVEETAGRGEICLYADISFMNGSRQDGYRVHFKHDPSLGWQTQKLFLDVGRPINSLSVYAFARYHGALKVRFRKPTHLVYAAGDGGVFSIDGVAVTGEARPTAPAFYVRDVVADDGYAEIAGAAKGLRLDVKTENAGDVTHYDVRVENTRGDDRAVTLVFAQPLPKGSVTWYQDGLKSSVVKPNGGEYSNVISSRDVGSGGLSPWPLGAVAVNGGGHALAIDCACPAYNRIVYNSYLQSLTLAVDLGFAPEQKVAHFRFSTFPFEAMYGWRGAFEAYMKAYPDFFKVRVPKQGVWMAFRPTSKVRNVEDFGFAYKEGEGEVPWDDAHGLITFHYTEPTTWWMDRKPVPGRKFVLAEAKAEAEARLAKGEKMARAWKTSVMKDERGEPCGQLCDNPWCVGALWAMCSLPNLPGEMTDYRAKLGEEEFAKRFAKPYPQGVDGEYLDSAEMEPASLDYDRAHFAAARTPLVFSATTHRPAIYTGLVWSEYTRDIARRVREKGRFMMANCTPSRYAWISSYMDVLGTESIWINRANGAWQPPHFAWFQFHRFLSGAKPYCFLLQEDFDRFDHACMEKSMHRMLAYAFFPGYSQPPDKNVTRNPETYYWLNPKYYERDRALFVKFVPLIRKASEAGWRPVNRLVYVPYSTPSTEQFGDNLATVFNFSSTTQTWDVVSLSNLSNATDLVTGRKVVFRNGRAKVTLPPETTMLLEFDAAGAAKAMAARPLRFDLAPIVTRALDAGENVIGASLAADDAFLAFQAAHPGAPIVLDSSTVPSTPDGSSPAWNAIRSVRRHVNGRTVFWKTITDRYGYLYWTPDQGKEDKVAQVAAYPDGRLALKDKTGYWWTARVREKMAQVKALQGKTVDIVFLGDSITHFQEGRWGRYNTPFPSVTAFTNGLVTLNLGIGGDRVEHALWRAKYGQLDGYRAKVVSILIGTNNCGDRDSATDIVRAIDKLIKVVREKQPEAKIVLMALWPREYLPENPNEIKNRAINAELVKRADGKRILWLDLTKELRGPDGKMKKVYTLDGCHPSDAGYKLWFDAFRALNCL